MRDLKPLESAPSLRQVVVLNSKASILWAIAVDPPAWLFWANWIRVWCSFFFWSLCFFSDSSSVPVWCFFACRCTAAVLRRFCRTRFAAFFVGRAVRMYYPHEYIMLRSSRLWGHCRLRVSMHVGRTVRFNRTCTLQAVIFFDHVLEFFRKVCCTGINILVG